MSNSEYYEQIGRNVVGAITHVMTHGGGKYVVVPIPVEDQPDLIAQAKIEVPSAVFCGWKKGERHFFHGKWSAKKQKIVWDEKMNE